MYFLERYTRGCPHEIVRSCLHMSLERGLETVKAFLQEHFGNETKVTAAYMEKYSTSLLLRLEIRLCFRIMIYVYVDATMQCLIERT